MIDNWSKINRENVRIFNIVFKGWSDFRVIKREPQETHTNRRAWFIPPMNWTELEPDGLGDSVVGKEEG